MSIFHFVYALNIPLALPHPQPSINIGHSYYKPHLQTTFHGALNEDKSVGAQMMPTLGAHRHLNCSHVALCKVPEKAAVILTLFAGSPSRVPLVITIGNNNVNNINNAFIPQQRAVRERKRRGASRGFNLIKQHKIRCMWPPLASCAVISQATSSE